MKEINLADYITGSDPLQNRSDFWAALAACKGQRAHYLYVPDPDPGVAYTMAILAADKMTSAQITAGEPGDSAIARFLVDWDLEIYGDGADHSVLSFGTDVPGMQFCALKMVYPFSLSMRGVRVTSHTPMANGTSPMTYGIYIPPKGGNPSGENRFRMEKSKLDWFGDTVAATAGPVNAINHTAVELLDSEIRGQKITVGVWNDPNDAGTKALHVERCKLFNTDKNSGWGSHLMYVHENVSWRAVNTGFYEWATTKFGIQNWGSNPNAPAKYSEADGCYFDKSGDGPAIITSDTGPCQVRGGRIECRQGIEARQKLIVSDVFFKPTPQIDGTIAVLSTYQNSEVIARNITCDMSEVGDRPATVFAVTNNNSIWDIDGANIFSNKRTASLIIYGSAPNITTGHAHVKGRNVTVNGYHVPDVDYAAGIRSTLCLLSAKQGYWDLANHTATGDMVSDRGALRLDASIAQEVKLDNFDIIAQRGLAMYSDASASGKVVATNMRVHDGRMQLVGGAVQKIRLPATSMDPTTRTVVPLRLAAVPTLVLQVLALDTDYGTVNVTGNPAAPIEVGGIYINLTTKTQTISGVSYTNVYASDDTSNFEETLLQLISDGGLSFGGIVMPAGKAFVLRRKGDLWSVA